MTQSYFSYAFLYYGTTLDWNLNSHYSIIKSSALVESYSYGIDQSYLDSDSRRYSYLLLSSGES